MAPYPGNGILTPGMIPQGFHGPATAGSRGRACFSGNKKYLILKESGIFLGIAL